MNSSAIAAIQYFRNLALISTSTFSRSAGSSGKKGGGEVGIGILGDGDRLCWVDWAGMDVVASSSSDEAESDESDEEEDEEEEESEDDATSVGLEEGGSTAAAVNPAF